MSLYRLADDGCPLRLTQAFTHADGRVRDLLERPLVAGQYRLEFDLRRGDAGDGDAGEPFFGRLSLDLIVEDTSRSYHVPLLLAPFSLTTHRGS